MNHPKPGLGKLETSFFSWAQLYNHELVKTGDLLRILNIRPKQENELLSRLARKGLIVRLIKGVYLVPKKIPPGGKWVPHEFVLISKLMKILNANYQIGGATAFSFYGLDEQVPNTTFIYNDKISGKRKVVSQSFYFIKVPQNRLGGTVENKLTDGTTVKFASLSRTLLDALYDWSRFNALPRAYGWITSNKLNQGTLEELVKLSIQFGNISTCKRLGFLLESINAPISLIKKLKRAIPKSQSFIPWIPGRPMKGKINRAWGLVING